MQYFLNKQKKTLTFQVPIQQFPIFMMYIRNVRHFLGDFHHFAEFIAPNILRLINTNSFRFFQIRS